MMTLLSSSHAAGGSGFGGSSGTNSAFGTRCTECRKSAASSFPISYHVFRDDFVARWVGKRQQAERAARVVETDVTARYLARQPLKAFLRVALPPLLLHRRRQFYHSSSPS
jgi:hypothetical protein